MGVSRTLVRLAGAVVLVAAGPAALHAQPVPPVRLSIATDGTQGNGASTVTAISVDGRQVLFTSAASNLVPGDTNGVSDLSCATATPIATASSTSRGPWRRGA